jgi:hypothetical protein
MERRQAIQDSERPERVGMLEYPCFVFLQPCIEIDFFFLNSDLRAIEYSQFFMT